MKDELDAYGVGVRAGAITPTMDDEVFFRRAAGWPDLTAPIKRAWDQDEGARRPITLTQSKDAGGAVSPVVDVPQEENS